MGEGAVDKLENAANTRKESLYQALSRSEAIEGLAPPSVAGARVLLSVIESARRELERGTPTAEVARQICQAVALPADIADASASNQQAERRWGNVESPCPLL